MKRIIIRVQWSKREECWYIKVSGEPVPIWHYLKSAAVENAVELAHRIVDEGFRAQVVSHRKDGVIQWERTYPRSSDPRRSRG